MSTIQFCDPKFVGYCSESLLDNEDDVTYADRIGGRYGVTGLNGTRTSIDHAGFDLDVGVHGFGLVSDKEIKDTLINSDDLDDQDIADLMGLLIGTEQVSDIDVQVDCDDDLLYDENTDANTPKFMGTGKQLLTHHRDCNIRRYNR